MKEGGWARGRSEQGESRRRGRRGAAHPGWWKRCPTQTQRPATGAHPEDREIGGNYLMQMS